MILKWIWNDHEIDIKSSQNESNPHDFSTHSKNPQKVEPSIGECFDTWTVFTSHRASPKSINHKNPSTCPTGKNLGLSPADEANGKRFSSENKGRTWAKKKCENVIFPNRRVIFRLCSRGPVEHISSQMVGVDLRPNCGEPWNVEGDGKCVVDSGNWSTNKDCGGKHEEIG